MILPFAFFGFWSTTLLVAAVAAAIPIIIHLLNRRRYQIVVWAAMRFLLNAQKQNTRRMRIEQLILLAVRIVLLLLIILAMASVMPWAEDVWASVFPDGAGFIRARTGRMHKVLVLDGSLSMSTRIDAERLAFDRARELAKQIVREAQPGDAFSVLLLKESPQWLVPSVSTNTAEVLRALDEARPAHGNASIPDALRGVSEKLAESPTRFKLREVYFLTDLQKATWLSDNLDSGDGQKANLVIQGYLQNIQKRSQTIFVDVRKETVNNVAVTELYLKEPLAITGRKLQVFGKIKNYGAVLHQSLPVELWVGQARTEPGDAAFEMVRVRQDTVAVKPGEEREKTFEHTFGRAGVYAVQMRIGGDDLDPDNARTVIVTVKDNVPVLLVNGKPAVERFDTATEFLKIALDPPGATPRSPFRPTVVSTAEFANASEVNLAGYDCIYLSNVGPLGAGQLRRLETHLRRGGGVIFGLGDEAADRIKLYNEFLYKDGKGLLPAKLIGIEQAPPKFYYVPNNPDAAAFASAPLAAFKDDEYKHSLFNVRLKKYVRAQPADPAQARVLLKLVSFGMPNAKLAEGQTLRDHDPLLIDWQPPLPEERRDGEAAAPRPEKGRGRGGLRYRGRVILMTSTWNMDWSSWPGSPSYIPMVHELTKHAIAGRLREQAAVVGAPLEEYLLSNGTTFAVTLHLPGGATRSLTTVGQGEVTVFRWPHTDQSGIYRLTVGQDARDYLYAVNVPSTVPLQKASESDPAAATHAELTKAYPNWTFQVVRELRQVRHQSLPVDEEVWVRGKLGPEIARLALYLVVILLWAEVILAFVFGHFSGVPGAVVQPTPRGVLLPAAVAVVAAGAFAVIAGVLLHATATGDFLGFLPPAARAWAESLSGIPAPATGEGRKWEPEFLPYFSDLSTDTWLAGLLLVAYGVCLLLIYRKEGHQVAVPYKVLLGGLRLFIMFLALAVWLPQLQVNFKRESWPDVIVLIDDSLSMGESDQYQDEKIQKAVERMTGKIRDRLREQLPGQIQGLRQVVEARRRAGTAPDELRLLEKRLAQMETQLAQLDSQSWRPNRLHLAQYLLKNENQDWLRDLLGARQMLVHVFHLDASGKAIKLTDEKGQAVAVTDLARPEQLQAAHAAVARLEPYATDSQLGTSVRQVLDQFGGSSVAAVIFLTDGITTAAEDQTGYEKNLAKVAEYAALKGVPLYLVGIGDDHELRDLRLHDLQVIDTVYVNDRVIFEARVTGKGFKNLTVPVVLKIREPDGTETELDRQEVKVDPSGKPVPVQLKHQPNQPGEKLFVVEVIPPKKEKEDRDTEHSNLRLQRTVFVQEAKPVKVLYVEGLPRYEYRFLKALLEREKRDGKGDRSIELKVLLLDADPEFPQQDASAIAEFPPTREELSQYDMVILGDADPQSPKLGDAKLRLLADFVKEKGGGLLLIAGSLHNPHAYRKTPLADVMPVEVDRDSPDEPAEITRSYRLELTPVGNLHPVFRLSPNQAENLEVWQKLQPMYWHARGFRIKPAAEVLAVHPSEVGGGRSGPDKDTRLPLVVQQFVGAGRCMFFGFDESYRWRFRGDEPLYNKFWIETVRYLSRNRISHTRLFLDRQTPYRQGEKIKVTVRFPDNTAMPGEAKRQQAGLKNEVKVMIKYQPDGKEGQRGVEADSMELTKVEGSWATYEGYYPATQKGKYQFWLSTPDVSALQPNKKQPGAEAVVVLPPGELDRLRMNREEMEKAAAVSDGRFYTVATADQLLDDLPSGYRALLNLEGEPWRLWNHWLLFLLALGVVTAEWLLRKRKHLL